MAKSCQDVSARMLELIYGELGDDERAALEAHIVGCPDCRAEREGFERTRAVARQVLDEPAPARARAAILAAAAHAAAAGPAAAAARLVTEAAAPAPARAARPPERRSFWDWVRTRWTLPTLATVGAVAVVVLGSRVFLNPEKTVERGHEALAPAPLAPAPPAPTAGPAAEPAPNDKRPASAPAQEKLAEAPAPAEAAAKEEKQLARRDQKPAAHRMRAAADDDTAGVPAKSDLPRNRLDALLGADKNAAGGAPLAGLAGGVSPTDREAAKLKHKDRSESPAARGGSGARYGVGGVAQAETRAFAPPPPPAGASSKPAATSAAPARKSKMEFEDEALDGAPPPRTQPSAPPPAPPRAQPAAPAPAPPRAAEAAEGTAGGDLARAKPKAPRRAPEPAPAAVAAEESPAPSSAAEGSVEADEAPAPRVEKKAGAAGKGRASETPVQRADRMFAEGRWIEAAAAYRTLLRDDPKSGDADRWRKRLALAEGEIETAQRTAAKAAKASKAPSKATSKASDAASQ